MPAGTDGAHPALNVHPGQLRFGEVLTGSTVRSSFYISNTGSVLLQIDTLIITGVSTGGCVRATAINAVSRGFNVAVVADAVADRIVASHKVALLDLWMKYTDVVDSVTAIDYLASQEGAND